MKIENEIFKDAPFATYGVQIPGNRRHVGSMEFLGKYAPLNDWFHVVKHVGSTYICDPPPPNSDIDLLCFTSDLYHFDEEFFSNNLQLFDTQKRKLEHGEYAEESLFYSYYLAEGNINLLVTGSKNYFDMFVLAAEVCKILNVQSKEKRIAVTHYLTGK